MHAGSGRLFCGGMLVIGPSAHPGGFLWRSDPRQLTAGQDAVNLQTEKQAGQGDQKSVGDVM